MKEFMTSQEIADDLNKRIAKQANRVSFLKGKAEINYKSALRTIEIEEEFLENLKSMLPEFGNKGE